MPELSLSEFPVASLSSSTIIPVVTPGSPNVNARTALGTITSYVDVRWHGADPTGVADSTTAIQAAINALTADGGIVYFPVGDYKVSATLLVGDGSTTAESTKHGIWLVGQTSAGAGNTVGLTSGVRLLWYGAAAGTVVSFRGPMTGGGMADIAIQCKPSTNAAGIGLKVFHVNSGTFKRVHVNNYSTAGVDVGAVGSAGLPTGCFIGGDDCVWELVKCAAPSDTGAIGLRFGEGTVGGAATDNARHTFTTCWFVGGSGTGRPLVLRAADNCTFMQCVFSGNTTAMEVIPPTGSTAFPNAISFINCAIAGSYTVTGTWTAAQGLLLWPYSTSDGGALVFNASRQIQGVGLSGALFGPIQNAGTVVSTVASSTAIASTVTETNFSVQPAIEAARINRVGCTVRVRAAGKYSDTGSPTAVLRGYFGTAKVSEVGPVTCSATVTNRGWNADFSFVVRTAGASGILYTGPGIFGLGGSAAGGWSAIAGTTTAAIDLTAAQSIILSWQWGTSDAANTVTLDFLAVDIEYPSRTS